MSRVVNRKTINCCRDYSFKPIKRPDSSSKTSKAYVDKRLKEFNLQQILRTKIEISGPLTGEFSYHIH